MSTYTIQQFISRAEDGDGISMSATSTLDLTIDGWPFTLNTTPVDIGKFFSARQVLENYQIRAGIIGSVINAEAGVTTLSIV